MFELPDSYIWDISKIFLVFTLTTIVGTFISFALQKRHWKYQQRVKTFEEISNILDQRLYRSRQVLYAFRSNDKSRINQAFSDYKDIVYKWNDNLNRHLNLVEEFFGTSMREELEFSISKELRSIGIALENETKNKQRKSEYSVEFERINKLNEIIREFDRKMLINTQKKQISFHPIIRR